MTMPELEMYVELLLDHYGKEYISDLDTLTELLRVEFDIVATPKELSLLTQLCFDTEDMQITLEHCGINY